MGNRITIANPIYDSVFKYLFEDQAAAKTILSTIMGDEVIELHGAPQEYVTKVQKEHKGSSHTLTHYRVDYAATIRLADGSYKRVTIEVQKAGLATDIMRFRYYLGQGYSNKQNHYYDEQGNRRALPIVTIYFLGYRLERTKLAAFKVDRRCIDLSTGEAYEKEREEFIDGLTHDSYIIQIPLLSMDRQSEIEWLLTIFDQHHRREEEDRRLAFEKGEAHELERRYPAVWKRLTEAIVSEEMEEKLFFEDLYTEELRMVQRKVYEASEKNEQAVVEKEQAVVEKEQAVVEKEQAVVEKEQAVVEKEQAVVEKEQAVVEKEQAVVEKEQAVVEERKRMRQTVQRLAQRGLSAEDIAETTDLPIEQVERWRRE